MFETQNGWTKQTMIDHVKNNFKGKSIKKSKSLDDVDTCLYRGDEGKKCAVGLFIPDSEYLSAMDECKDEQGTIATYVIPKYGLEKFMPLNTIGMREFQSMHDNGLYGITPVEEQTDILVEWINEHVK